MGERLAKLSLYLPKDLIIRFRTYVLKKHGKLKGGMSVEARRALEEFLEKHEKEVGE